MSSEYALATAIEETVRATAGVASVFRAGTTAVKLVDAGTELVGLGAERVSLVRVTLEGEKPHVEIALGVHPAAGSVATLHSVHAAVESLIAERGVAPADIVITVMRVNGAH